MKRIRINDYTVNIYLCGMSCGPIIYTHMDSERSDEVMALCNKSHFTLAAISGVDWNKQLSPWPAQAAFRGVENFSGEADAHITEITTSIVPAVREELNYTPSYSAIMGYSLDGLFSLYSLYKTNAFSRVASISGSLWYDGFIDYIKANSLKAPIERAYFSLGNREGATKNARLAKVYNSTVEAEKHFAAQRIQTRFELNDGGHFVNVSERISKAIEFLLE